MILRKPLLHKQGENPWNEINYSQSCDITSVNTLDTDFKIEVFPNPFFDNITLEKSNSKDEIRIEIFDVLGRQIFGETIKDKFKEISLDHLSNGTYVLLSKMNSTVKVIKIAKSDTQ